MRKISRAVWQMASISLFFRHNDLLTFPVYPTSRSRCIMSSTSIDLSFSLPAPFPEGSLPWGTLPVPEPGLACTAELESMVGCVGMSRGAGVGLGPGGFCEEDEVLPGEGSALGLGVVEGGCVREPFASDTRGTPSGSDTLIRGAPLDETGEVTESGGVCVWGPAAREWLPCGAFSLSSSWNMSGAASWTSFSLSLEPFLDFLDDCWPMSVWDAGTPLEGDWDLDLASLDVNTERSVGASLRNGGRERSGWAWERGEGNGHKGRKWQATRELYDGVFGH